MIRLPCHPSWTFATFPRRNFAQLGLYQVAYVKVVFKARPGFAIMLLTARADGVAGDRMRRSLRIPARMPPALVHELVMFGCRRGPAAECTA